MASELLKYYKIGSGEVNNLLLLEKIAKTKKPVIISSGMSSFSELDKTVSFLKERNWMVHNVIIGNEEDFNVGNIKEELFQKIKSISDKAEDIKREIEYNMIAFCSSKGKDMSKIKELLKSQEK